MTRLVDPDAGMVSFVRPTFKFSPDHEHFVIVTLKGNLSTGRNEYELLLFDCEKVLTYLRAPASAQAPAPVRLVHAEARHYQYSIDHAIDAVRWLDDNRTIAFVGRDAADVRQVFVVDTQTQEIRQLTSDANNVAMFDVSLSQNVLVYATRTPPDWSRRNEHGYAVKSDWMQDLGKDDPSRATMEVRYFVAHLDTRQVTPVQVPVGSLPWVISLAPDAKAAILFAPLPTIPTEWLQLYPELRSKPESDGDGTPVDSDAWGAVSPWLGQFFLVATADGTARPVIDAPAKLDVIAAASWSKDSKHVVLASTFMPRNGTSQPAPGGRDRGPAIVEVNTETGALSKLADSEQLDGKPFNIGAIERLPDDRLVLWQVATGASGEKGVVFRKAKGEWLHSDHVRAGYRIDLSIAQSLNTAPDVAARDPRTGKHRVLTNLNPGFRSLTMGQAELFSWTDRWDRKFTGAIVYPPNFRRDRRYPVILQTTAARFTDKVFLIDGFAWTTSAFAARAFANRDILVLQMPAPYPSEGFDAMDADDSTWWRNAEAPRFTAMMEGAIDALASAGLADRSKVGIIGFSRTCMHVMHALAFSRYPLAAATLADGLAASPFGQSVWYGAPEGMVEFERDFFIGAPLLGSGISKWIERSPLFHLDTISAPIRFESYGLGVPAYWDMFALLKRHQRPAELVHIPYAHHVLVTPYSRYTSQQGNVDWFAFWLKGERNPADSGNEQYARWERLAKLAASHQRSPESSEVGVP